MIYRFFFLDCFFIKIAGFSHLRFKNCRDPRWGRSRLNLTRIAQWLTIPWQYPMQWGRIVVSLHVAMKMFTFAISTKICNVFVPSSKLKRLWKGTRWGTQFSSLMVGGTRVPSDSWYDSSTQLPNKWQCQRNSFVIYSSGAYLNMEDYISKL